MRLVWVVIPLVLIGIIGVQESSAEEKISVNIDGGKLLSFEQTNSFASMIFEIDPILANVGAITIEIPKNIWHLADSECDSVPPLVLVDGNESTFSEYFKKNKQIITVDIVGGSKEIELATYGPAAPHTTSLMYGQFCFMQEQGIFLSPKKQSDLGFRFWDVQCKDALIKIIKKISNSPACVKPATKQKLIERGWILKENNVESILLHSSKVNDNSIDGSSAPGVIIPYDQEITLSKIPKLGETAILSITLTLKPEFSQLSGNSPTEKIMLENGFSFVNIDESFLTLVPSTNWMSYSESLPVTLNTPTVFQSEITPTQIGNWTVYVDGGNYKQRHSFYFIVTEDETFLGEKPRAPSGIGRTVPGEGDYVISKIDPDTGEEVIIDEIRNIPEPIDATNVIDANNQFAIDFYSQVSQESNENIFFSPWSISTAFAIAFEGAKGSTADEIRQVFGFPSDYEQRTSQFKSAMNSLNPDDSKYQLSVANALWLAEKFEPFAEYVETATNFYDSEVNTVDFISNDGVDQINAWVEDKTQEKIKDILNPGSTNADTRLAITNAIYFKGNWVTQFNENNTSSDTFWNGETTSEIPLMHLEPTLFNYTQTDQLQILKMPYEGDRLSMLVLLPNENDGLTNLEESLSIENLNLWLEQLTAQQVEVFMPKFKLETTYDLNASLIEMGMSIPFSEGMADFGGIAPISLHISQAIHKAFVDVNEEGTEAAAVTVISIFTTSERPPPPVFRVDHPFVFLIQDDSTGNILFIGRMINP